MKETMSLPIFLTVIIPVYNEHEVLKNFHSRLIAAIASIHKSIEILYVDDGSQDKTKILLLKYVKKSQIRLISYSTNMGKGYAIKKGMLKATGTWRLFIDIDQSGGMFPLILACGKVHASNEINKVVQFVRLQLLAVNERIEHCYRTVIFLLRADRAQRPFLHQRKVAVRTLCLAVLRLRFHGVSPTLADLHKF